MIELRLRGGGDDGPDRRPGADRRVARRRGGDRLADAAPSAMAPRRRRRERPRADGRTRRSSRELVRLAAFEVPGVARVGRGGPAWRRLLGGPAVSVRIRDDRVLVRLWIVARPGPAARAADRPGPRRGRGHVERLLGLELGAVTVLVDGVGG